MKKLRESVMAKFVAWMLCIASVLGIAVLGICIAAGILEGLFGKTRKEALKSVYEGVNAVYSVWTFDELGNRLWAEEMRENYFKYGIVKSDALSGIDLHDRLSYLDTNMTDEELKGIDPDQLFIYQVLKREDGFSERINRGYYGSYEDIPDLDMLSDAFSSDSKMSYHYADRICYDEVKGIIYYRADGNYYPVQNVSLCYASGSEGAIIYNYNYDFNDKGYKLNYKTEADGVEWVDGTAQSVMTDEVQSILDGDGNGSIVNFAKLKYTGFDCDN